MINTKLSHLIAAFTVRRRLSAARIVAGEREECIQTIAGSLLDGLVLGHKPSELLREALRLYRDVEADRAGLDVEWLEGRRKHPTTRERFAAQRVRSEATTVWRTRADKDKDIERER